MLYDSSSSTSSSNNKKIENVNKSSKSNSNTATSSTKPDYFLKLPHPSSSTTTTTSSKIQTENNNNNNNNKMPEMISMPIINGTTNTINNNQRNNKPVNNDIQLTQKQIDELKESIKLLNDQIFKDPNNRTRPPSEYIELYDSLTEKLHKYQKDLEERDQKDSLTNDSHENNRKVKKSKNDVNNSKNTSSSTSNSASHTPHLSPSKSINDNYSNINDNNETHPSTISTNNLNSQNESPNLNSKTRLIGTTKCNSTSITSINTVDSIHNSYIRIFIETSTYVIKRNENVILRDAVTNRLKTRNYKIDNCVAYNKENYKKLDWNIGLMNIDTNEIIVVQGNFGIMHDFKKKSVTFRSCDCCKRRAMFTCVCSKCDYTICLKITCREKSEEFACHVDNKKSESDQNNTDSSINKRFKEIDLNKFSQQILPVSFLVEHKSQNETNNSARDRSRSENDLLENLIVTSSTPATNKLQVPKSPVSAIPKSVKDQKIINGSDTLPVRGGIKKSSRPALDTRSNEVNRRDSLKLWEIPYSDIEDTGRQVGSGSFGTVHEATNFYHGKVAIKYLNVQNPSPSQREAFRNEAAILKETRHDNILLFIGYMSKPFLAIVTEWCEGSSLYKHLHVAEESWNMYQLVDIAKQTATGMEYLHARDILHRDLKSNNIFLVPDEKNINSNINVKVNDKNIDKWTVKIGDFGLATVKTSAWNNNNSSTAIKPRKCNPTGSILWMAPEVIRQILEDPYSQKSDIYSFGVVLYELVTCRLPYAQKEQDMILFQVGMGRLRPNPEDARKDTPIVIKNLITQCCEFQRDKRPVFDEINLKLKSLRIAKIQRAQSAPDLSHYRAAGTSIIDDDIYPLTPLLDTLSTTHFNNTNL